MMTPTDACTSPTEVRVGVSLSVTDIVLAAATSASSEPRTYNLEAVDTDDPSDVLCAIGDACSRLLADLASAPADIASVGIAVGGHVDSRNGRVVYAPSPLILGSDWAGVSLADLAAEVLGCPVVVENDLNCMANYHRSLSGRGPDESLAVVYVPGDLRGVGCGIVVDGRILRGAGGGAGELGHVVIQPGGPRCRCGNRGCLEAMISLNSILRTINYGDRHVATSLTDACHLAERGDRVAEIAFRRAGEMLGQGLATLINLLNPATIIVGGPPELVASSSTPAPSARWFRSGLESATAENSFSNLGSTCQITFERLTSETAALGAALLGGELTTPAQNSSNELARP
ncbi:MAG TPA: ROK family protein [Acidimicrobiales bacterium]|nr:ROK family protein [Acidimicrobiales bacterium]